MATWRGEVTETNSVALHYLRTGGPKPPVVLLHGLMGSGACWTPLARALEAEFDVIMPDARGHGRSAAPEHGYRYDDLASDVAGLINGLGLSRPVLVGHSMGGMTAAMVAGLGAPLRGLVLVDPTFLSPERQREVHESDVAEQHRRALSLSQSELVAEATTRHPHRAPAIIEFQADARSKTRLAAFEVLKPPNPEYRELVRAIKVPSLLVIGDHHPVVTLEMAVELHSLNPRIRIEQIQHASHSLPFEQPERLAAVVLSFLRELV